jgi:tetratricopeptide (TPR) repeat protein
MNFSMLVVTGAVLGMLVAVGVRAAPPDTAASQFEQSFKSLHDTVVDAPGMFRYSEVYPKLEALEQLAHRIGEDSPQRARALDLMSLVRAKRGDDDEVVRFGEQCLALKSVTALAPEDHVLLLNRVARSASNLHRYALAAQRYRSALDFNEEHGGKLLDDAQRLGVMEHEGYVLHEDGRYAEALAINTSMLHDAERLFGADDARLTTVLLNLAQNQYKLGHLDEATATLQRCLALAQRAHKDDVTDDCLFQLGVLAFERGNIDGARRWMKQRVHIAERSGDASRVSQAKAAATELEQRIAKH